MYGKYVREESEGKKRGGGFDALKVKKKETDDSEHLPESPFTESTDPFYEADEGTTETTSNDDPSRRNSAVKTERRRRQRR